MNAFRFLLIIVAATAVACSDAASEQAIQAHDVLEENSCAIHCPISVNSRYAGFAGGVGCAEGASPLCQCTDDSRPMAGCELLYDQ